MPIFSLYLAINLNARPRLADIASMSVVLCDDVAT
jgi:hypothetical protein